MLTLILRTLLSALKSRQGLMVENLALRHQLVVLQRSVKKPRLKDRDRILWALLARFWTDWWKALVLVQPETVIRWHRRGFRRYWRWKSRGPGRPKVPQEIRDLIRDMSRANPQWGAPRIHGELLKLGIEISQATVSKYMVRHRKPPSQSWHTFLSNHAKDIVSIDFFTVPTVTFRILFVLVSQGTDEGAPRLPLSGGCPARLRSTDRNVPTSCQVRTSTLACVRILSLVTSLGATSLDGLTHVGYFDAADYRETFEAATVICVLSPREPRR